jgi:hypothetical protein
MTVVEHETAHFSAPAVKQIDVPLADRVFSQENGWRTCDENSSLE